MQALITGGAGFIGSHLADRLLAQGWRVRILDNESTGDRSNVPQGAKYFRGDVRDKRAVARAFAGQIDVVFHLAAQVSNILSYADPTEDVTTNVVGTLNVLDACVKRGVPRFLYASSMALYGQPDRMPVSEAAPCRPLSFYGISKLAAEQYVFSMAARRDLKRPLHVTGLRMFNVYGPRQSLTNMYQGVVSVFIANMLNGQPITLFGTGRQKRDFVYVDDVVDAWIRSAGSARTHGRVINVGTGRAISILAMLDAVLASFGKSRSSYPIIRKPELPGDQFLIQADARLARRLIRWTPRTSFEDGLKATVAWARQQR